MKVKRYVWKRHKITHFTWFLPWNHSERVWKWKNRSLRAFGVIEMDWRVVRSPRLLSRIPWDLNKPPRMYNDPWSPPQTLFTPLKPTLYVLRKGIFGSKTWILMSFHWKSQKISTSLRLYRKKCTGMLSDHANGIVGKPRIQAIPRKLIACLYDA